MDMLGVYKYPVVIFIYLIRHSYRLVVFTTYALQFVHISWQTYINMWASNLTLVLDQSKRCDGYTNQTFVYLYLYAVTHRDSQIYVVEVLLYKMVWMCSLFM